MTPEQHHKKLEAQRRYREKNRETLRQKSLEWQKNNLEKMRVIQKRYRENHHQELLQRWRDGWQERKKSLTDEQFAAAEVRRQKWIQENTEKNREIKRLWAANNKHKQKPGKPETRNAATAKRRAKKLQATPKWFSELDDFALKEAYRLAKLREKSSGIKWHVDHKIPLQGKVVCGLHCWNNVQVIPATVNISKGNSF